MLTSTSAGSQPSVGLKRRRISGSGIVSCIRYSTGIGTAILLTFVIPSNSSSGVPRSGTTSDQCPVVTVRSRLRAIRYNESAPTFPAYEYVGQTRTLTRPPAVGVP
jgi:hypothetical protein